MTWFDRLLPLLDRLPTTRLTLMRDIIGAIVERRRSGASLAHGDLHSALSHACDHHRAAG